jgi:GH25 family lysozyme M1 (1,4-beta-N-acetylmuramidase)
VDIQFENYYSGASAQGIKVGAYCYTRAKSVEQGIEEAENLVSLLGGRQLDYPVALDLEDDLQIKNMTKAQRTQLILEYKKIIEAAGYDFVVYANLNWLNNYIDQSKLEEENVDIWIARYRGQSLGHGYAGGGNVRIWQYSSTGQVDGILDAYGRYINVDLDVCYEDY